MRISLHLVLRIGGEPEQPEQPERHDTELDALVEHGDNYPTPPELHVGFRHVEDD